MNFISKITADKKIIGEGAILLAIIVVTSLLLWNGSANSQNQAAAREKALLNRLEKTTTSTKSIATSTTLPAAATSSLVLPISSAAKRITKKPFGLKVSPTDSPVKPERFSGYHTGTDFEILPGEENKDVPIYAICNGPPDL
jgi:hypothetical protein